MARTNLRRLGSILVGVLVVAYPGAQLALAMDPGGLATMALFALCLGAGGVLGEWIWRGAR